MRRRSLILGLSAAAAGTLVGCGRQGPGRTAGVPTPPSANPPSAVLRSTGMLASARHSTLPARPVTPYRPKAGTAPAQAFAVGRRDFTFARGERQLPVRVWYPANGAPGDDPATDAVAAA